jgi:hypothetical protein
MFTAQTNADINFWRRFEIDIIDTDHFPVKFPTIPTTFHLAALMLGIFEERNSFGVILGSCGEFKAFLAFIALGSASCRNAIISDTDVHVTV